MSLTREKHMFLTMAAICRSRRHTGYAGKIPHIRRVCLAAMLTTLLAACATTDRTTGEKVKETSASGHIQTGQISSQTLRRLRGKKMQQIHDRPLNAKAKCNFKDVNGGKGRLDLLVERAEVKRLSAEIEIPKHGICRFDLAAFKQTTRLPNVELHNSANTCLIRLWEQNKGVTVAFNNCRAQCSGDAVDYLWPILVNPRNGRCA